MSKRPTEQDNRANISKRENMGLWAVLVVTVIVVVPQYACDILNSKSNRSNLYVLL